MVYMALGKAAEAFSVALGLGGGGGGAAALIERDAEKAVVELEEHAVRSWETREANALEELEVSGWPEVCLASRKVNFQNSVQQIFGRPGAK
jgi:hypothetical protein